MLKEIIYEGSVPNCCFNNNNSTGLSLSYFHWCKKNISSAMYVDRDICHLSLAFYNDLYLLSYAGSNNARNATKLDTVYPKKYAHGFVVLCFVVAMQSFIMNSHEVFIHIHQGCFVGTGAIVRLPQRQWNKPDGYGKISQCITTTKHSKSKTVWIFLGIYCKSCFGCRKTTWHVESNYILHPPKNLITIIYRFRYINSNVVQK